MIEWRDQGALIAARPHGETSVIVEVFTPQHGRHAGVVRGGASRKQVANLQPGTQLDLTWKARLDDHLGTFTVEPIRSRAALVMGDRLALAGLNAVCALLCATLPEREAHLALYDRSIALLDLLGQSDVWPLAYLQWEMALLEELGFAMDLSACAATGVNEDLCFVSPKSGKAVSRQGAGEWASRMLDLPPVLKGQGDASGPEIAKALVTTGYFIENKVMATQSGKPIPSARGRLADMIAGLG